MIFSTSAVTSMPEKSVDPPTTSSAIVGKFEFDSLVLRTFLAGIDSDSSLDSRGRLLRAFTGVTFMRGGCDKDESSSPEAGCRRFIVQLLLSSSIVNVPVHFANR